MYLEFFGLKEPPFSITPDPRFVYLSERHRDALAHLLFGVGQGGGGGFVQLTGEVGTGKTTLSRLLLEQLPENTRVALVLNPKLSPAQLLETICEELRIGVGTRRGDLKELVDALNAYLLHAYAQGLRVVLIVDEAQELPREALEQVRLLTNLESPTQKLLQIVLLGQPELRERLAQPDLRQLAQRITARYHLTPLNEAETDAYLRHRLAVAGCPRFPFTKLAARRLHRHSLGVPRLINVIAERALLAGYARDQAQIGERLVDLAAAETLAPKFRQRRRLDPAWPVAATLALALGVLLWLWPAAPPPANAPPVQPAATAAPPPAPPPVPYLSGDALAMRLTEAGAGDLPAWTRLLALWRLRAEDVDLRQAARCPTVVSAGVFCLHSSGGLSKIAALGRPVLLRLRHQGREAWAIVLGVDASRVRLTLGGETFDIDRSQLERVWSGEYFALWRAPAFVDLPLRRGDRGAAVDWLAATLAARPGGAERTPMPGPQLYDAALEQAVRNLQLAYGLAPDGIVGPETLLAVAALREPGPELRRQL